MKRILAAALVGVLAVSASAANIAFWDFNNSTNVTGVSTDLWQINPFGTVAAPADYANDLGDGSAAISVWGGGLAGNLVGNNGDLPTPNANHNFGSFTGNTLNDIKDTPVSGSALAITGSDNNDHYFLIKLNDQIEGAVLSYATRGTSTGFGTHALDYTTDGGATWTALESHAAQKTSTWVLHTVNVGDVFAATTANAIRLTVTGATSTNGNNRFDNILVTGTIVPEPTTLALLGFGSLLLARRRR